MRKRKIHKLSDDIEKLMEGKYEYVVLSILFVVGFVIRYTTGWW